MVPPKLILHLEYLQPYSKVLEYEMQEHNMYRKSRAYTIAQQSMESLKYTEKTYAKFSERTLSIYI